MPKQEFRSGTKIWKLPKIGADGKWHRVIRLGRHIPWGYMQDEDELDMLIPVPEQLDMLEDGKEWMRRGYSRRQVAAWLSDETGRYISHVGLKKRLELEDRRKRSLRSLRVYKKKLKETIALIEKLENDRIGVNSED